MSLDEGSSGAVGCVSDGSFDGSHYSAISASIVVDNIIDPDGQPTHNGLWLGLTGNNTQLWNNSQVAGGDDGWALGVRFLAGAVNFVYDNASGNEVIIDSLGGYSLTSLQDGFTVEYRFDASGWEVCLSGITGAVDGQGSWPVNFDYATITSDNSIHASVVYQQANEAGTIVDVTSISVNGDTTTSTNSLAPTTIFVTNAESPAVTGAANVNSGDLSADSEIYVRERRLSTQTDRRISSYLNFDVSSLTTADLNSPGFSVSFTADYDFQLNDLNSTAALVGRVTNGSWNGTTVLPLHAWGIDAAADRIALIPDISTFTPPGSVSADITGIVTDWVNGTTDNFGLVVFVGDLESNAAGFSNPRLVISSVPDSDGDGMPDSYETANGARSND